MSSESYLHKFSEFLGNYISDQFNRSSLSETVKDLISQNIYCNGTQIAYSYIKTCCILENNPDVNKNQVFIESLKYFADESTKDKLDHFHFKE